MLSMLFYGVIAAGGVYSAASSASTAEELARQIREAEGKLVVCSSDVKGVAVEAARLAGVGREKVCVLESEPGRLVSVDGGPPKDLIGREELGWKRITDERELEESLICLLYSSGTTGVPKAVLLSHRNVVAEAVIPAEMVREYHAKQEAAGAAPFEYRTLAHLPAAHIAGVQGYLVNPFYAGGPVYWMPKFDFEKFLEYNRRYRITFFFTVPPIYLLIAKSPLVTDQFDTLRVAISGAAPLGKELQDLASSKLGKGECYISQTWGLSETTGSVTAMPWDMRDDTGSVSPLLPNMSMRFVFISCYC
jgi:4-coumarate--CoA ligase